MAGGYAAGAVYVSGFGTRISFGFRSSDFGYGRLAAGSAVDKRPRLRAP